MWHVILIADLSFHVADSVYTGVCVSEEIFSVKCGATIETK